MEHQAPDPDKLIHKSYVITMVGIALYTAAVVIFVL